MNETTCPTTEHWRRFGTLNGGWHTYCLYNNMDIILNQRKVNSDTLKEVCLAYCKMDKVTTQIKNQFVSKEHAAFCVGFIMALRLMGCPPRVESELLDETARKLNTVNL